MIRIFQTDKEIKTVNSYFTETLNLCYVVLMFMLMFMSLLMFMLPRAKKCCHNAICICFFNSSTDRVASDHANLTIRHQ